MAKVEVRVYAKWEGLHSATFMSSVWKVSFETVRLRNGLLCGRNEKMLDLTILTLRGGVSRGILGAWGRLDGEIG